jgi:hypothetical protein
MLNGLEKSIEHHLPENERRWTVEDDSGKYAVLTELLAPGWPSIPEP